MTRHGCVFRGVELEALILEGSRVAGIADAVLDFSGGVRLWVEIKTDDTAIGALVRQVKMYRHLISGDSNWLVVVPHASIGAREILAHAGIGVCVVSTVAEELISLTAREKAAKGTTDYSAVREGY